MLRDSTDDVKYGIRQHDIRIRLLCLLLNLSNADTSGEDLTSDEGPSISSQLDIENELREKQENEVQKWRNILCEGETSDYYSSQLDEQPLSDWTSSDEDDKTINSHLNIVKHAFNGSNQFKQGSTSSTNTLVMLPGCSEPLKPPQKILPPGNTVHADSKQAKLWMSENVLPHYWVHEKDGKTNSNYPMAVPSSVSSIVEEGTPISRSTANLVNDLDQYYATVLGIPVTEKTIVTEYQIMREIIWTFRYPQLSSMSISSSLASETSNSYPLFKYDYNKDAFIANPGWLCMASISPESLLALLETFGEALTSLHHLASFVKNVLDRPTQKPSSKTINSMLPPLTYEAYAAGIANLIKLFSADLMDIEKIIRDRKQTFTVLDLKLKLASWFKIMNCLARFHLHTVTKLDKKEDSDEYINRNWQASVMLLAGLNAAINSESKADMYALFVDLFLKTIAPYFRIMGLWVSQGRLEDWRNEFVFAVNSEFHTSQMRLQARSAEVPNSDEEDIDVDSASDIQSNGLQEAFWTRGFISRPYKTFLMSHGLNIPEIFEWTLPRILTCGKSIEILTILQKQGRLEKSSVLQFNYHVSFTQLYDEFVANLKKSLESHQIDTKSEFTSSVSQSKRTSIKQVPEVRDIIEDVSDFDPYLIAAFDKLFLKAGSDSESSIEGHNKKEKLKLESGGKEFLLLSNYGLDPIKPLTTKFESCLLPVTVKHVDKASRALLNLFRNTLNLEQHLSFVRKVYLMESGDLMLEFYSSIFEACSQHNVQRNADNTATSSCFEPTIDSLSLTMMLHDCLYRRPQTSEEMVERFSVKVYGAADPFNDLESNINLTYHVDWPLNIVLHSSSLTMYNKVFQFILKVKHSLWALQQIDAKDLAKSLKGAQNLRRDAVQEYANIGDSDDDSTFDFGRSKISKHKNQSKTRHVEISKEEEIKENRKIHRILLLRSWLLHFVGNIHSYLMTRVLHTTQLELQDVLREEAEHKINDLDDIIQCHNKYIERIHDRCFLHPSTSVLRQAVLKVLNTCLDLHRHCNQFVNDYIGELPDTLDLENDAVIDQKSLKTKRYHLYKCVKESGPDLLISEKLLKNFEENYFRSHQFLATTLRNLSQKRNVPHLDGLASALIHTAPNRTHS